MAISITNLSGGNTPADGSDPRTFPAIWNATATLLENLSDDVIPTDVTSPTTGQLLQYDGSDWVNVDQAEAGAIPVFADAAARTTAIAAPTEGMVTYLSDVNQVQAYTGSAFTPVSSILQVVSTSKTDTFSQGSVAGGTFVAVTGLSVSITPTQSTSKVLISGYVVVANEFSAVQAINVAVRLKRGATALNVPSAAGNRVVASSVMRTAGNDPAVAAAIPFEFLDSPSTTSATTYSIDIGNVGTATSTLFVNRTATDTDTAFFSRASSVITVMEVAG